VFLIFGIKRMSRRLGTVFALCSQCHTPAAQVIGRRSTWFSLFFVPLIPLGTKYFSTCTLCGVSTKLTKEQATQMVATAAQSTATAAQSPTPFPPSPAPLPDPPAQALPHPPSPTS
jgi:hypothetical protein